MLRTLRGHDNKVCGDMMNCFYCLFSTNNTTPKDKHIIYIYFHYDDQRFPRVTLTSLKGGLYHVHLIEQSRLVAPYLNINQLEDSCPNQSLINPLCRMNAKTRSGWIPPRKLLNVRQKKQHRVSWSKND